jgi:hypothetical protein
LYSLSRTAYSFSYHLCALALRSLRCFFKAGVLWCRNNGLPSFGGRNGFQPVGASWPILVKMRQNPS